MNLIHNIPTFRFRNRPYSILILLFVVCNFSCKKFLSEKPSQRLQIASTLDDLQALLDNAKQIMNHELTPSMGEASTGDYFLLNSTYNDQSTRDQQLYTWISADYFYPNDWSKGYGPVLHANYCLEVLEKIERTPENQSKWNNVKGSALFFRSYNFLNLLWNYSKAYDSSTAFADLGIVLRLKSDVTEKSVRSSVQECYQRVIIEAKESISYLPDNASHPYRPSKGAAYGLLARAYLSMRMYDSAWRYADLFLGMHNTLIDYKKNNTGDPYNIVSDIFSGTAAVFRQFNQETIFYTEMNAENRPILLSLAKMDTTFLSSYGSSDLRKTAFFRPDGAYHRFRGSYAQSTSRCFSGIATDEMYLIRAECYARRNELTQALSDLNFLLSKRHTSSFSPLSAANSSSALNIILEERRKELVMRGIRWMDIKRLNKEGRNIILTRKVNSQVFTLQPNSNYYALPLPKDIIEITGIPQNPY